MDFGDKIRELYKDKFVQLRFNDSKEINKYSDFDLERKTTLFGRVIDAEGQALVLEVQVNTPKLSFKKKVLVNVWFISSIMEITDDIRLENLFDIEGHTKDKRDK
jgi:hypothetical protein